MGWISDLCAKFRKKPRLVDNAGAEKLVEVLTEQVCGWFETPIQKPPRIVVYSNAKAPSAYYSLTDDTITVYGTDNVTTAILAHEVAHAVVLRLDGKITPRMHEILAGYAEFEVRKALPDGK